MISWPCLLMWRSTRRCPSWMRHWGWRNEIRWLEASHTRYPTLKALQNPADSSGKNHTRDDSDYSLWLINFKDMWSLPFILILVFSVSLPSIETPKSFWNGKCQANIQAEMVDPFAVSVSSFFPLPALFSEETICLLSLCFVALRKPLKLLLLPWHSIMLFEGRISWSHGKEDCCPGSFTLYSPYDSQNCIVPSQRGKIGPSCKSLVLF